MDVLRRGRLPSSSPAELYVGAMERRGRGRPDAQRAPFSLRICSMAFEFRARFSAESPNVRLALTSAPRAMSSRTSSTSFWVIASRHAKRSRQMKSYEFSVARARIDPGMFWVGEGKGCSPACRFRSRMTRRPIPARQWWRTGRTGAGPGSSALRARDCDTGVTENRRHT